MQHTQTARSASVVPEICQKLKVGHLNSPQPKSVTKFISLCNFVADFLPFLDQLYVLHACNRANFTSNTPY